VTVAIEFGGSVLLDKPVQEVWRFLTDPDRDTNWRRPHVLSSRKLTDGPLAVGSRLETVNKFWGKRETVVTEITTMDPPSSLSWKQVNKGTFLTDGSYRLEGANGGTRFTLALSGQGKGAFKLLAKRFARYQDREVIPLFLKQLKEAVA